ncbi:uncharacterized protein [Argopecten irradians]|uniref:uncharacterized protein n=1 Tax=Argopecten irradians TaxID=31199 RepID=UPI0037121162
MGCLPSKDISIVDESPQAGYFAVSYTFKEKKEAEEMQEEVEQLEDKEAKLEPIATSSTKTKLPSAKERLGRPLFGGGLSSGFGRFETLFSKKVNGEKVKEKPKHRASRGVDMTLVYQVPRSKLNINPHADNTKGYFTRDCRVSGLKDTDESTQQLMDFYSISPP